MHRSRIHMPRAQDEWRTEATPPTFPTSSIRRARVEPILDSAQVMVVFKATLPRTEDDPTVEGERTASVAYKEADGKSRLDKPFRVNPVRTYAERMTETRSELRKLVRERLCAITGEPSAQMRWARAAYMRDVVARYRVRIEGWPLREVPFKNLSDVPNLGRLELLLRNWKENTIYFRKITEEEYQAMVANPSPWLEYVETGEGEQAEAADDA